jgi:hypothetical protein
MLYVEGTGDVGKGLERRGPKIAGGDWGLEKEGAGKGVRLDMGSCKLCLLVETWLAGFPRSPGRPLHGAISFSRRK